MRRPRDPETPGAAVAPAASRYATAALALLTTLNFLNYVDRYVIAAVLPRIQADPAFAGISDAQFGALQTAFFYSYMLLSPITGALGRRVPRRYLIAAGVLVWSAATVASGVARTYSELLLARSLIGAGEAGYATVAPAFISDLFHRDRRNRVLSIFYLATPVGSALGFMVGGIVAARWGDWRYSFFVAGVPGMVLGLVALVLPEPTRGAQDPDELRAPSAGLWQDLRALARNHAFFRVTLGMTLMTFAVGGLAFWMPSYFQEVRGLDVERANLVVGGFAVAAGVLGTLAGSLLADLAKKYDRYAYVRVSAHSLLAAVPLAIAMPFAPTLPLCVAALFLAELLAFINTGPLNAALIESVPPSMRETAVGINLLVIHALGDALSPPLLGAIAGRLTAGGMPHARALGIGVAVVALPFLLGGLALLVGLPRFRDGGATPLPPPAPPASHA